MSIVLAKILGVVTAVLAFAGLLTNGLLFGFMNADTVLDVLRLVLAAYLLYAGFVATNRAATSIALIVTGILYAGLGIVGVINPHVGGLLPSGITGFDIVFHATIGVFAMWLGFRENKQVEVRL